MINQGMLSLGWSCSDCSSQKIKDKKNSANAEVQSSPSSIEIIKQIDRGAYDVTSEYISFNPRPDEMLSGKVTLSPLVFGREPRQISVKQDKSAHWQVKMEVSLKDGSKLKVYVTDLNRDSWLDTMGFVHEFALKGEKKSVELGFAKQMTEQKGWFAAIESCSYPTNGEKKVIRKKLGKEEIGPLVNKILGLLTQKRFYFPSIQ